MRSNRDIQYLDPPVLRKGYKYLQEILELPNGAFVYKAKVINEAKHDEFKVAVEEIDTRSMLEAEEFIQDVITNYGEPTRYPWVRK